MVVFTCRPALLTHDHCYTAMPRPLQPVATRDRTSPLKPPQSGGRKGNPLRSGAKEYLPPRSFQKDHVCPPHTGPTPARLQDCDSAPLDGICPPKDPQSVTLPPSSEGGVDPKSPSDGGQGQDPRRCMLCTVEGDAAPNVR